MMAMERADLHDLRIERSARGVKYSGHESVRNKEEGRQEMNLPLCEARSKSLAFAWANHHCRVGGSSTQVSGIHASPAFLGVCIEHAGSDGEPVCPEPVAFDPERNDSGTSGSLGIDSLSRRACVQKSRDA